MRAIHIINWANHYQDLAIIEYQKLNNENIKIADTQAAIDDNQAIANEYLEKAKEYEGLAREQVNLASDIYEEIENKIKSAKEMKEQIDERVEDDSSLYLYNVTKRDARGRIEGELFGSGVITQRFYDPVSGKLTSIKTDKGETTLRDLHYT